MFSLCQIPGRVYLSRLGSIGSVRRPSFSVLLRQSDLRLFLPPPFDTPLHSTQPHTLFYRGSLRTHSPQEQYALSRLARIEAAIVDILRPECDACAKGRLKCDGDGRNPCSWCIDRHPGGVAIFRPSELEASQQQHVAATGPVCTYSDYSEQARRYGLHRYVIPPLFLYSASSIFFYCIMRCRCRCPD